MTMKTDILTAIPLFEALAKDASDFIVKRLKTEAFASGEVIVRQGDLGDSLYIITNGMVKVTKRDKTGAAREIARFHAGDFFGEMSLLAEQPRSADITAVTDTTTLVLYKADLDRILQEYPTIAVHFSKILSKRLREASQLNLAAKRPVSVIAMYSRHVDALLQTVLAVNLAASFTKELLQRVIFVDASNHEKELSDLLRIELPKAADQELRAHDDILDKGDIFPFIRQHRTGLHILSLGAGSKLKQRTYEKDIRPLLEKLRGEYDYILINCAKNITRLIHSALEQADLILYLTPLAEEALQRAKKDADLFAQGERENHNFLIGVIQERHESLPSGRSLEEALAPHVFVPLLKNDYVVEHFLRTGRPFVFEHPKSNMSRSLQRLTRRIGRVRIGLALGSGSARGFAHVGVLKVLEANDIPLDMITGTSMGALVGGFFAAGISAAELEQIVLNYRDKTKVRHTIFDLTIPRYGLSKGNRLVKFMRSHIDGITFDELQIPFAAIATDINTGREVVLRQGVLWQALRASGSVPVMFEPYQLDGRYLIDGGITNPLPTDILIEHDMDIVISCAVNLTPKSFAGDLAGAEHAGQAAEHPAEKAAKKCNIIDTLSRTLGIMSATNTLNKTRLADVDIRPDVAYIDWTDFHRGEELVREGEHAAEKALPAILELLHGNSH